MLQSRIDEGGRLGLESVAQPTDCALDAPRNVDGTAQISEWTSALTSAHHATAAALAARTSTSVPVIAASVSSGTARSRWV